MVHTPFALHEVTRYGRGGIAAIACFACLWPSVFGARPVQVVLVRGPDAPDGFDLALVSTDLCHPRPARRAVCGQVAGGGLLPPDPPGRRCRSDPQPHPPGGRAHRPLRPCVLQPGDHLVHPLRPCSHRPGRPPRAEDLKADSASDLEFSHYERGREPLGWPLASGSGRPPRRSWVRLLCRDWVSCEVGWPGGWWVRIVFPVRM